MWNKLTVFCIIRITTPKEKWWKNETTLAIFSNQFHSLGNLWVLTPDKKKKKKKWNAHPHKILQSSDFDIRHHIVQLIYCKVTRLYNDLDKTHTFCWRYIPCLYKLKQKHTKHYSTICWIIWRQSKARASVRVRYFSWLLINAISYSKAIDH